MSNLRYADAPAHILDGINRYVLNGIEPGSFVKAVLSNDLAGALTRADTASWRGIHDILEYCRCEIPAICWGSPARVKLWQGMKSPAKNAGDVVEEIVGFTKEYSAYRVLANSRELPESSKIQDEADEVLSKINSSILSAISNAEDIAFVKGEIQGIDEGEVSV